MVFLVVVAFGGIVGALENGRGLDCRAFSARNSLPLAAIFCECAVFKNSSSPLFT